jgi:hypothetical protein
LQFSQGVRFRTYLLADVLDSALVAESPVLTLEVCHLESDQETLHFTIDHLNIAIVL